MLILINSFTLVQLVVTQYLSKTYRATHHTHRCILSTHSNKNICHYREAFMKIELPVGGVSFKLPSPLFWKLFSPPLRTTRFFWFILRLFSWKLSRVRLSCNSAGVLPFNGCRNTWDIWDNWSNCLWRDMCHFISICAMLCHFMLYFISFFLIWGDITFRAILCHLSILGSLKIQFVLCLYEDIFCLAQNLSSSVKIDIASSRCHRIIIIMVIKIIKIVKITKVIKIIKVIKSPLFRGHYLLLHSRRWCRSPGAGGEAGWYDMVIIIDNNGHNWS